MRLEIETRCFWAIPALLLSMSLPGFADENDSVHEVVCKGYKTCEILSSREVGREAGGNPLYVVAINVGEWSGDMDNVDQWLLRQENQRWQRIQKLLSHLASKIDSVDDSSRANVSPKEAIKKSVESHVQIGSGTITLVAGRGSMMRAGYQLVFRLDPWQPITEQTNSHGDFAWRGNTVDWDWLGFQGVGTVDDDSEPARIKFPKTKEESDQAQIYWNQIRWNGRPKPSAKSWHFRLIPSMSTATSPFIPTLTSATFPWRNTLLANCALSLDSHNAYLLSGQQTIVDGFYLRALVIDSGKDARTDVYVDLPSRSWTHGAHNWLNDDHLEIWIADIPGPNQWGIRISDGKVFRAYGKPTYDPVVELTDLVHDGKSYRAMHVAFKRLLSYPAISLSLGDGGSHVMTLVSNAEISYGDPRSIGGLWPIDPRFATCSVENGQLVVTAGTGFSHPDQPILSGN